MVAEDQAMHRDRRCRASFTLVPRYTPVSIGVQLPSCRLVSQEALFMPLAQLQYHPNQSGALQEAKGEDRPPPSANISKEYSGTPCHMPLLLVISCSRLHPLTRQFQGTSTHELCPLPGEGCECYVCGDVER
jgi:hypothetical protein